MTQLAILLFLVVSTAWAAPAWVPAFKGRVFQRPVALLSAPDATSHFFVVEQDGRIMAFDPLGKAAAKVFLDIQKLVRTENGEEGLLSAALHPNFKRNGYVYVWYSKAHAKPRAGVLERFQARGGKVDIATRQTLLKIEKRYGNHNGGTVVFGPDGMLYLSVGDGGAGGDPHGNGQNLGTLLGKILRLDVDQGLPYTVPKGNPFVATPKARPEIWSYGWRNPWRMSFDPGTRALWVGDVGQNAWEEIDIDQAGGNFGWNLREGRHDFDNKRTARLVEPVFDYARDKGACVTGGIVYRGQKLKSLRDKYVFADFSSSRVWTLDANAPTDASLRELPSSPENPASFAVDAAGEVYVIGYGGSIFKYVE